MDAALNIQQMRNISIIRPSGKDPIPLGSGTITRLLGDGGMASVYEIWNSQLEVHRAVKLLHPNCNTETRERFQTEIKITAKLHHPNIIEIHGVGEWNGLPYIEMEKADGMTLEQLIHIRGALPTDASLAIGLMVSRALDYAHNHEYVLYNNTYHGIIHRDLKPGNIMVCKDGTVKLMDFGIARPTGTSFHTIDGAIIGTLQYLSPEQLEGRDLDITTDIYSFGICLYEMFCGYLAFPESNITRLLADKSKNRYKPLSSFDIKIPNKIIDLVQNCMTHDKTRRPQTASLVGDELNKIFDRFSSEKPENVIAEFLSTSFKDRITPKSTIRNIKVSKYHFAIILIAVAILYTIVVVSGRNSRKPVPVSSTTKNSATVASVPDSSKTVVVQKPDSSSASVKQQSAPKKIQNQNTKTPVKKAETTHTTQQVKTSSTTDKSSKIETLKTKYDTDDLLLIAQKEIQDRNAANALMVLNNIDPDKKNSLRAQVLKSRALEMLDYKAFSTFVISLNSNEAELLINKARIFIDRSNTSSAKQYLDRAATAPREIIASDIVSKKVFYYKALVTSKVFDITPDETNWKDAIEAWYIVKREMRSEPSHEYYRKADQEITRISAKYRAIKDNP